MPHESMRVWSHGKMILGSILAQGQGKKRSRVSIGVVVFQKCNSRWEACYQGILGSFDGKNGLLLL